MKNIRKTTLLFALVLGGTVLFTGCREDEKVDLEGCPETPVGIAIAGTKDNAATVTLNGVYDSEGKLVLEGELSRTYNFTLAQANPQDVLLKVEPVFVNIPEDKVTISETELVIPAGNTSVSVDVALIDGDMSFIATDINARTYELGVRIVDVKGYKVPLERAESKVLLKKEAYSVGVSISGESGREVNFVRSYNNSTILDEEPMTYTFKATLNKPAKADVKLSFTTGGLAEGFVNDVTVTPAAVTIPAGVLESEEITWTLTDDFLLTTADPEKHIVTLTVNVASEDTYVVPLDEQKTINFNIEKIFNILSLVDKVDSSWSMYDRTGWTADGENGDGDPDKVFDGNKKTYYGATEEEDAMTISVDMQQPREIHGVAIRYYADMMNYAAAKLFILISDDGQTWTSQGVIEKTKSKHYVKFMSSVTARYIKLSVYKDNRGKAVRVAEFEVYGAK